MTGTDKGQDWAREKAEAIIAGRARNTQQLYTAWEFSILFENLKAALAEARAEERRSIADRLREPDEALIEAVLGTGCVSPPDIMFALPICRVIADYFSAPLATLEKE